MSGRNGTAVLEAEGQTVTSPMSNRELKPAFAGLARRGYNPRSPERARHLVLGLRKSGKSSLACSHPGCIVLDWEGGTDAIVNQKAFTVDIKPRSEELASGRPLGGMPSLDPWERFQHIKKALLSDAKSGSPNFQTVAFDSVDFMLEHMMARFCAGHNAAGKVVANIADYKDGRAGWFEVRAPFIREIQDFDDAGYGLILNSHLAERIVEERTVTQPRLSNSFREALLMMVDQILHIEYRWESLPGKRIITVNGKEKEIADPQNRQEISSVVLRTVAKPTDRERGCRVEIEDGLVLPSGQMWETYAERYRKEVEKVRTLHS